VLLGLLGLGVWWWSAQAPPPKDFSDLFADLIPNANKTNLPPPKPVIYAPAVQQVSGVMWNATGRRAQAPFEIVTSSGADYYLKLIDANTGKDAVAVYVKGGVPLEVEVPLGNYYVRYASGETWRGESFLFGPNDATRYNQADEIFRFAVSGGYINGYTIELIRQSGGNLSTRAIDASQF
jgi:hypothetical protein